MKTDCLHPNFNEVNGKKVCRTCGATIEICDRCGYAMSKLTECHLICINCGTSYNPNIAVCVVGYKDLQSQNCVCPEAHVTISGRSNSSTLKQKFPL